MSRKLIYLVIALALLVGMVPGVVMAQNSVYLTPVPGAVTEWNVMGASETFTIPVTPNSEVTPVWSFQPLDGLNWNPNNVVYSNYGYTATVTAAGCGALQITATVDGITYYGEKKWGEIASTVLSDPGSTQMLWSEIPKTWTGSGSVTEKVIGKFRYNWESAPYWDTHLAGGAVVYWYLFQASLDPGAYNLNRLDTGLNLKNQLDGLVSYYGAKHVVFTNGNPNDGTTTTTVSGSDGTTTVYFSADAEECVRIICLATYPNQPAEYLVRPEFTSWNFWTQEMEKVPQVRWAGEKIVLEKYWGQLSDSERGRYVVRYSLEQQSPGTLERVTQLSLLGLDAGNLLNDATSVWCDIDSDGVSRAILTSEKPGECDVTMSLYYDPRGPEPMMLVNQHGFVVFFLKLESITLTKVEGEREYHNDGKWIPENPVIADPTPAGQLAADVLAKEANVSADDLLRVRVRGWFMGDDQSIRQKEYCDVNGNGILDMYDYVLPEGRWVLPDDWEYLAGPQWNEFRIRYDIMNTPELPSGYPSLWAYCPMGTYGYYDANLNWVAVSGFPVIGPYSSLNGNPGLPYTSCEDIPDGNGWGSRDTIVSDGILNWFDCPMPPAKVTFEILSGPGYFKAADKWDIYYMDMGTYYIYTNPYYAIEIPANEEIPPFCNNGGYDWDSWGITAPAYGPYFFWTIVNQLKGTMPGDGAHPTKVQVYSDNHGEAMVYINGDWNLNLPVGPKDFIDVPYMSHVGTTTVKAYADYPYLRKHPVIVSNPVQNDWYWGKDIVILVEQLKMADNVTPDPTNKKVWVLVSDRDEFAVEGETIVWQMTGGISIFSGAADFRYGYADWTQQYGWTNPGDKSIATTKTYLPSEAEALYLEHLFGLNVPAHAYGVSWIIVDAGQGSLVYLKILLDESVRANGEPGEGIIERFARSAGQTIDVLDFSQNGEAGQDPCDPIEYLSAGWNLVVFKSSNQSIETALKPIKDYVVSVWAFDNKTKDWDAYSPTAPRWANDLKNMDTANAYWIEVSQDVTWAY
jgi:hypothetical protein